MLFIVLWRLRIEGCQNIPPSGAVIFAANHRSLVDPPLAGSSVPRPIHYLAKAELFRIPLLGWYMRRVNAFPVKRVEHDVGAFKHAQRLLERGECILLFPEGGRRREGPENACRPLVAVATGPSSAVAGSLLLRRMGRQAWKAKPGVGMLSCKTGAPVVPVYIHNTAYLVRFKPLRVVFGKPIYPPRIATRESYQALSDRVMRAVQDLRS